MSNHEQYDPELIREIEEFLRQERQEGEVSLSDVREEWRDLVPRMHDQGVGLEHFLSQPQDVSMNIITPEQAVIENDELTTIASGVAQLATLTGASEDDDVHVRRYPDSDPEAFTVGLRDQTIPSFIPTRFIIFENWLSGHTDELIPQLAQALKFNGERPIGRLTIGGYLGAVSDPQTRVVMDYIVSEFPEAPHHNHYSTEYYFFADRTVKVARLPSDLLGQRSLRSEPDLMAHEALSDISAGDLPIAKIGLLAVEQGLKSQIPIS